MALHYESILGSIFEEMFFSYYYLFRKSDDKVLQAAKNNYEKAEYSHRKTGKKSIFCINNDPGKQFSK